MKLKGYLTKFYHIGSDIVREERRNLSEKNDYGWKPAYSRRSSDETKGISDEVLPHRKRYRLRRTAKSVAKKKITAGKQPLEEGVLMKIKGYLTKFYDIGSDIV